MNCPMCTSELRPVDRGGIEIDVCPRCRGVWLDRGELEKLIAAASSYYHGHRGDDDSDFGDDRRGYQSNGGYAVPPGQYPPKKKKGFFGNLFDFDRLLSPPTHVGGLRAYPETGSLQSLHSFRHHSSAQANWVRPR